MFPRVALVSILLTTGLASAQPGPDEPPPPSAAPADAPAVEQGFLAGGGLLGADHFINGAFFAEGGIAPMPSVPIWLHGLAALGGSIDAEGAGGFWRVAAGVETRTSGRVVHLFVGADVGVEHQTWSSGDPVDPREEHEGAVIGGRIGLEAGGRALRARLALDVYRYHHAQVSSSTDPSHRWIGGGELSFALAHPF